MSTPSDKRITLSNFVDPDSGFSLDLSGMPLPAATVAELTAGGDWSPLAKAHAEMLRIEAGAIKNPDEKRKVTHFSDRLTYAAGEEARKVEAFAAKIRAEGTTEYVVINGIGGSALGPQLLQFAINGPYWNELDREARKGNPRIYFVDNTDPAGLRDALAVIDLAKTLVVTVSKSGKTRETKNNMLAFEQAYAAAGIEFGPHAVAVTMPGSYLDKHACTNGWRERFAMADSIGGRTSETNIVGHVPAALTGIDFTAFVEGAKQMDALTRVPDASRNPAYLLAVAWYAAGNGRGDRNMVIVPYSDRLVLLGKYLQQLVMESLGKELDLDGNVVHQGLNVFGNKGGTDAHAYIQQLNDGRNDFFATFIEILEDADNGEVEPGFTMGDYLHAFKQGLMKALRGKGRPVIDMVLDRLDAASLGMIIALYERAVAYYAELIRINAFHQPGVQAYKLASESINKLSDTVRNWITAQSDLPRTVSAADLAAEAGICPCDAGEVEGILAKFAVNRRVIGKRLVSRSRTVAGALFTVVPAE